MAHKTRQYLITTYNEIYSEKKKKKQNPESLLVLVHPKLIQLYQLYQLIQLYQLHFKLKKNNKLIVFPYKLIPPLLFFLKKL